MTDQVDARRNTGVDPSRTPTEAPEPDALEYEIAGERPRDEQAAFVDESDVKDDDDSELTDTEIYEGELEAGRPGVSRGRGGIDELTELELRTGETDNPDVAAEEGLAYVPPIDPPVIASENDRQGVEIAAGFGSSALDEPYDDEHRGELLDAEDDVRERIHEALRADSTTSTFADRLAVGARGGIVHVRGTVDDVDDTDNVIAVIERVDGVTEVVDELEVAALS